MTDDANDVSEVDYYGAVYDPLVKYLTETKSNVEEYGCEKSYVVVIGNCACDLDSAACAVSYAYMLNYLNAESKANRQTIYLPVLNITYAEYKFRTEVQYVMNKIKISENQLFFRDTIDLKHLAEIGKLELVLVDHHVLRTEDEADLSACVIEVIDHRPVMKDWPLPKSALTIKEVGSCATLVFTQIKSKAPGILQRSEGVIKLLFFTIILDTHNCNKEMNRFTQEDEDALDELEEMLDIDSREDIYSNLLQARINVQGFTGHEILLKDAKFASGEPVCTLPYLVQDFLTREDADESMKRLLSSKNCEIIIVIGIKSESNSIVRDIGIYSKAESGLALQVLSGLSKDETLALKLEEIEALGMDNLKVYNQHNITKTRKHILPVVERIVNNFKMENGCSSTQ